MLLVLGVQTIRISTLAPRRERIQANLRAYELARRISTLAPRRERDPGRCPDFNPRSPQGAHRNFANNTIMAMIISTLAPRRERICTIVVVSDLLTKFQPSLPAGNASWTQEPIDAILNKISTLAPRRERIVWTFLSAVQSLQFQPSLPAGSASAELVEHLRQQEFQPSLPAGSASSESSRPEKSPPLISTLAPRRERISIGPCS